MGDLKTFITEQEKLAFRLEPERGDSPVVGIFRGELDDSLRGKQSQEHGKNSVKGIHYFILHSDLLYLKVKLQAQSCFKAAVGKFNAIQAQMLKHTDIKMLPLSSCLGSFNCPHIQQS